MKGIKKGLLAGMVLCCMPVLSACSFKETLGVLWNSEDKSPDGEAQDTQEDLSGLKVDENVEKPAIANELGEPVTYGRNGMAEPLTIEASVNDGGTLTYQWYRNNVDSNGGGTAIEGATENSYTPSTEEAGTTYYYVVVTNTVGEGIQLSTSATKCVTVTEEEAVQEETQEPEAETQGQTVEAGWQKSDNGWWYQYEDGTYPVNKWEEIDGKWYVFDEKGYIRTGWYQEGDKWYYLNEDGSMAVDTDVDGYHLGSDGVMQ